MDVQRQTPSSKTDDGDHTAGTEWLCNPVGLWVKICDPAMGMTQLHIKSAKRDF